MFCLKYIIEFFKILNDFTVDLTMTGHLDDDEIESFKFYSYENIKSEVMLKN
jgi:hypothetical protein